MDNGKLLTRAAGHLHERGAYEIERGYDFTRARRGKHVEAAQLPRKLDAQIYVRRARN